MDLHSIVDRQATVVGTARNAHMGAVVLTEDRTPVYIAGLQEWDGAFDFKKVKASGMLRFRPIAPIASVDADGAVSHGMSGAVFVLDGASWSLDKP